MLILVRDPISRLKHGINHGGFKIREPNKAYNIKQKAEVMVDRIYYTSICGTKFKPDLSELDFAFQARSNLCGDPKIWQYDSTIKEVPNPKSIHYIDMSELMPDKVFDTLTKLAMKFNWQLPKEKDRWIFESKICNQFRFLLPITISINKEIQIIVAELIKAPKDKIDILPQMSLNTLGLKIGFFLEEEQAKKLFNETHLLEFVKEKMQKYLYALKDKTTSVEKNKVKEEDVLAYLRANPKLARIYKSYFDSEFTHIKAHRPDIVASWKYYQEFERMCEELYRENI